MSPTLLEGFVVIVLLIVAWQIGMQLAPEIFRGLKSASNQFDKNSNQIEKMVMEEEEEKPGKP